MRRLAKFALSGSLLFCVSCGSSTSTDAPPALTNSNPPVSASESTASFLPDAALEGSDSPAIAASQPVVLNQSEFTPIDFEMAPGNIVYFLTPDITNDSAVDALTIVSGFASQHALSPAQILQIYRAEELIGRMIRGSRPGFASNQGMFTFNSGIDTAVFNRGNAYVTKHANRFREISDNWKGELNYWEPNAHWATFLEKNHPNSREFWLIRWDLESKDFYRTYTYDLSADGLSCSEYYDSDVRENPIKLEYYDTADINQIKSNCEIQRERFDADFNSLRQKYRNAPIRPALPNGIDRKHVISNDYFSIC